MKIISEEEYKKCFGVESKSNSTPNDNVMKEKGKASLALDIALDTRRFEISLYWERAKYFWAFIATALAAFAVALRFQEPDQAPLILSIISCLGIVFSFAWFLVNKGSKRWQENWENHVTMLENETIGPLFKTILSRHSGVNEEDKIKSFITGPDAYSVSKINQIVSLYVFLVWIFLFIYVLVSYPGHCVIYLISGIAVVTIIILFCYGKSSTDSHIHLAKQYSSKIKNNQ